MRAEVYLYGTDLS